MDTYVQDLVGTMCQYTFDSRRPDRVSHTLAHSILTPSAKKRDEKLDRRRRHGPHEKFIARFLYTKYMNALRLQLVDYEILFYYYKKYCT